jgi:hypothetical protein
MSQNPSTVRGGVADGAIVVGKSVAALSLLVLAAGTKQSIFSKLNDLQAG